MRLDKRNIIYSDDRVVTYEYDGVNNLTAVTEDDGRTTTCEYDGMRRVVRMDYPHGWVEEYEYESIGQLLQVTDSGSNGKDMKQQKYVYEYDVCGSMVYEYMRGNNTSEAKVENEYDYDALHCVIRAEEHYGHEVRAYTYDSLGNLSYEEDSHNNQVDYTGIADYLTSPMGGGALLAEPPATHHNTKEEFEMSLDIPDKCPICGHELSIDDIDYQPRGDKLVSMLYCPNNNCRFKKKLDGTYIEEDMEDEEDDNEGVDLFPNGRDYDAEDEDGP